MGKKSRKASKKGGKGGDDAAAATGKVTAPASPPSRCATCSRFLKDPTKGTTKCPGCDKLFCDPCAAFGSRKTVGFVSCDSDKCPHPPRCADCAFGKTHQDLGKENAARRKRKEPIKAVKREGDTDYPVSVCGHCSETFCFPCSTFSTEGVQGHYCCFECGRRRCFSCCVESGDSKHFIMHCFGCEWSKCIECDPDKVLELSTCKYYCGKCSSDPNIVGDDAKLMLVTEWNDYVKKNGHKKLSDL